MNKISLSVFLMLYTFSICACSNDNATQRASTPAGRKYLALDTFRIELPAEDSDNIEVADLYDGIYTLIADSLHRQKFLVRKNLAYFTTFQDLGMGLRSHLYVYDLAGKRFIRDTSFGRNYLYSSAAIMVLDTANDRMLAVSKQTWDETKDDLFVHALFYDVNGRYFRFLKDVSEIRNNVPEDTALVSFIHRPLSVSKTNKSPSLTPIN